MKSKLSTDIRKRGPNSIFMRTGAAHFGLREWKGRETEYRAPRFAPALLDEDILVLPRSALKKYVSGSGLHFQEIASQALLAECSPMQRRKAELDPDVIQLVSVFVLRYGQRVLTYKRSQRLPEARLHGTYSVAFGGHLNPDDAPPLLNIMVPELGLSFVLRELSEEVRFPEDAPRPEIEYRGLLYDEGRDVSKQHLGLVYDVQMASEKYEIGERGFLIDPRFETVDQIRERIDQFENWSVILINSGNSNADVTSAYSTR
jgi:predicted NUDIX family phosphoesterase